MKPTGTTTALVSTLAASALVLVVTVTAGNLLPGPWPVRFGAWALGLALAGRIAVRAVLASERLSTETRARTRAHTGPHVGRRSSTRVYIRPERRHSDGGRCCECGGAHECEDCPVFL